jgi:hypothetical protein
MNATTVVLDEEVEEVTAESITGYDSTFLTRAVMLGLDKRKKSAEDVVEGIRPAINRPGVFLALKDNLENKVGGADSLLELCSNLQPADIVVERGYHGRDHKKVVVLKCRLPESYVARVAYIQADHVPHKFSALDDGIVLKRMPSRNQGERGKMVLLCRQLLPVWTDRNLFEVPRKIIMDAYHYVTMKIDRDGLFLREWFPGIDVHSNICASPEEQMVLVGSQYNNNNNNRHQW